ncbi:MAG: hypothetical protein RSE96_00690 [Niameybacter sp.]
MSYYVQEKKCVNCRNYSESKYYYYTHDNRMVECHIYTCRTHGHASLQQEEEHCLTGESKRKRF